MQKPTGFCICEFDRFTLPTWVNFFVCRLAGALAVAIPGLHKSFRAEQHAQASAQVERRDLVTKLTDRGGERGVRSSFGGFEGFEFSRIFRG